MNGKKVTFSGSGDAPDVEVVIGFAQLGKYRLILWDSSGTNPQVIGEGLNVDEVEDRFGLGDAGTLNGRILSVESHISSPSGPAGEKYALSLKFHQGGQQVDNQVWTGEFQQNVATIFDRISFRVV